jgi:hypothetical protein
MDLLGGKTYLCSGGMRSEPGRSCHEDALENRLDDSSHYKLENLSGERTHGAGTGKS